MADSFKISGKKVEIPAALKGVKFEPRPGGWIIATLESGERRRFMMTDLRGALSASLGGKLWFGQVQAAARAGAAGAGAGDSDLTAQFPGKVRKLLVSEGQAVEEGQSLLLVEAMKMEFTIKAPVAAKVAKVLVKEGQQISPGDRFVELA